MGAEEGETSHNLYLGNSDGSVLGFLLHSASQPKRSEEKKDMYKDHTFLLH